MGMTRDGRPPLVHRVPYVSSFGGNGEIAKRFFHYLSRATFRDNTCLSFNPKQTLRLRSETATIRLLRRIAANDDIKQDVTN